MSRAAAAVLVPALALAPGCAAPGLPPPAALADAPVRPAAAPAAVRHVGALAWLEGVWVQEDEAGLLVESWAPPAGDVLVGSFVWSRDGRATLYELFAVEETPHGLRLVLRHFDRGLEPWASEAEGPLELALVEAGPSHAVFADPAGADPRRLAYRRAGDALEARLEGAGTPEPLVFRYRLRTSSASSGDGAASGTDPPPGPASPSESDGS